MKRFLLVLTVTFSIKSSAQSSLVLTNVNTSLTIAPNATVYMTTRSFSRTALDVDMKNMGTTKNAYKVRRYDLLLNQTGTIDSAIAHFCYATSCYLSSPSISLLADTLLPGQSASELVGPNVILEADLDEGAIVGKSIVKYTLFNTALSTDTVQFMIKYNYPTTGILENNSDLNSFEIFPNPMQSVANLSIVALNQLSSRLHICNALGDLVYEQDIFLKAGENNIAVNLEKLNAGIYFASIKTENGSITKKIMVQ